jgi:hypothetical protein
MSGTCKFCGCTAERACAGDCAWIDAERTICSACLPKLGEDELGQLWLREIGPIAALGFPPIQLDVMTAFATLAVLQLGLRHPEVQGHVHQAAGFARGFADALGDMLAHAGPATAEVVRRGFVGCFEPVDPHTHDGEQFLAAHAAHAALGEEISPGGIILP